MCCLLIFLFLDIEEGDELDGLRSVLQVPFARELDPSQSQFQMLMKVLGLRLRNLLTLGTALQYQNSYTGYAEHTGGPRS